MKYLRTYAKFSWFLRVFLVVSFRAHAGDPEVQGLLRKLLKDKDTFGDDLDAVSGCELFLGIN